MKEIIQDILETEKKARTQVEEARQEAKRLRLQAEEEAKAVKDNAREKAQEEARALIAQAEAEAKKARDTQLGENRLQSDAFWDEKKPVIGDAVDRLFARLKSMGTQNE